MSWREQHSAYIKTKAYEALQERSIQLIIPTAKQLIRACRESDFAVLLTPYQDLKQTIEDLFIQNLRSHIAKDHLIDAAILSSEMAWGLALKKSIQSLNSDPQHSLDPRELHRAWRNYLLIERLVQSEQTLQLAQTQTKTKGFLGRFSHNPSRTNKRG